MNRYRHLNLTPEDIVKGVKSMSAIMKKQAENDSDDFYKKRNQNHTNLAHTFAVESQHPEYKLLPVLKGEQRNFASCQVLPEGKM